MKAFLNYFIFALFALLFTNHTFAQGDRCERIQPFCAGDAQFIFPNSNRINSDVSQAESGPDYSCLDAQPYPAWFFLKISKPGDLNFEISQTVNADGTGGTLDVDYVAWGPFGEGEEFCSNNALSTTNLVGCGFSYSPLENLNIKNAKNGDIYVVLITNYSKDEGFISLNQVNTNNPNAGSTDCSIISLLGEDQNLCGTNTVQLEVTNIYADSYKWFKKDPVAGNYIEILDENSSIYLVTSSGEYKVIAVNKLTDTEVPDEIKIQFFDPPIAVKPQDLSACSLNDTAIFNLETLTSELSSSYSGSGDSFSSNFYESQSDLDNNRTIPNPSNFEGVDGQTLFATIANNRTSCVSQPVNFQLNIQDAVEIEWNNTTSVCIDSNGNLVDSFILGKDLGDDYIYNWTPDNDPDKDGVENPILMVNTLDGIKEYSLKIENKNTGCQGTYVTSILRHSPPSSIQINTSGSDFDNGYIVEATVEKGVGDNPVFEYSLDGGNWQQNNRFNNVSAGNHSVAARVENGCGSISSMNFTLVGYPRFFTPNGDGYNDTWNVINDEEILFKRVFIFNRFGKLLKQLDPAANGWDGTFNGNALPADDYWFMVELDTGKSSTKQYKGHFTLKR